MDQTANTNRGTSAPVVSWQHVYDVNDGMGVHEEIVLSYIKDQMNCTADDLAWTLETFEVSSATPDPHAIRSTRRIEAARKLLEQDIAPAIIVIETPSGRRIHVDGWHRLGAAEQMGLQSLPAYIGRTKH